MRGRDGGEGNGLNDPTGCEKIMMSPRHVMVSVFSLSDLHPDSSVEHNPA